MAMGSGFGVGAASGLKTARDNDIQMRMIRDAEDEAEKRRLEEQARADEAAAENKKAGMWSNIGSIGGTILGGVGGALAAPFTGGLLNPVTGAMLGSSLGGGLGRGVAGLAAPGSQGQYAAQGAGALQEGMSPMLSYLAMKQLQDSRPTGQVDPNRLGNLNMYGGNIANPSSAKIPLPSPGAANGLYQSPWMLPSQGPYYPPFSP